jgi:hypothetical protein
MSDGPTVYVYLKMAYNPDADVDALLKDYFTMVYGPKAGEFVQRYYMEIEKAIVALPCDRDRGSRGLDELEKIYTPEFLTRLSGLMDQASDAAKGDKKYEARVAMTGEGLKNAQQYMRMRQAMAAKQYAEALRIYENLVERNERLVKQELTNHYTVEFLHRFVARGKDLVQLAAISAPNKVLVEFPDLWRSEWDKDGKGTDLGYAKEDFDDSKWPMVSTYKEKMTGSAELNATAGWKYRWFRATFEVPKEHGELALFFSTLEKEALVFINGKLVNGPEDRPRGQWGVAFTADVTKAVRPGTNVLSVRRPNAWGRLVEQPVVLVEKGQQGQP